MIAPYNRGQLWLLLRSTNKPLCVFFPATNAKASIKPAATQYVLVRSCLLYQHWCGSLDHAVERLQRCVREREDSCFQLIAYCTGAPGPLALSVCLSVCLSVHVCLSLWAVVYVCVCSTGQVCLSVCLSVCLLAWNKFAHALIRIYVCLPNFISPFVRSHTIIPVTFGDPFPCLQVIPTAFLSYCQAVQDGLLAFTSPHVLTKSTKDHPPHTHTNMVFQSPFPHSCTHTHPFSSIPLVMSSSFCMIFMI